LPSFEPTFETRVVLKSNLLATKLHRPSLPVKRVQRPSLIQRLNEGLELNRQVTLVSAPAGFGKTTCVSEWVDTLDNWPVTWLSLGPSDDDPGRFFAYFIAALQKVDADLGREIEGVLRSGQLPPAEIINTTLINDILELEGRFLLVLDDFHVIQDRFIFQVLENLITNLPQSLHLALVTREDPPLPLAQLRAHNRLTEIRARDLRFTRRDVDCFLNETMGLSLSEADLAILEDKTEGWIVGLQLAGLSVQGLENPSGFIASLSGEHRFILSYLTEQVLSQQPEEVQQFLLQTSILDKLNGDLCNAITGRSDARTLLESLYNANLFLIPLDDEGQWYRYHHLFADLLRNLQRALEGDKITELHRRASHWYTQAGMASEAIEHALAAEDYEVTVVLLENHALGMIMQGYAKTVNGWARALPDEWASQSPRTNLAFAWMYVLRGAYAQASQYLEQLQSTLADFHEKDASIRAEWLVLQALMLYMQGDMSECMKLATRALELAPERNHRVRSLVYFAQASVYQFREEYSQAIETYRKSIQLGRATENLVAEMMSTAGLAGMVSEHGQLHLAFEIASQAVDRIERSGMLPPISAVVYASLGDTYYQWYQIEEARRYLLRALRLSILGGSNTVTIFCRVLLSRLFQSEGDLETAAREIQKAADLVPVEAPEYVRQEVVAQQVCIYLARDHPDAAEMALQGKGVSFWDRFSFPDLPPGEGISYSAGLLYNSSLRVLLYQARAGNDPVSLELGLELADHLIAGASKSQQLLVVLEALLMRAQLHARLGDHPASVGDYVKALGLAEPEGFIGVFVEHGQPVAKDLADLVKRKQLGGNVRPDYVERILAAFSGARLTHDDRPVPVPSAEIGPMSLIEPLTERELEVLSLMVMGLKYKEIATRLFISQNTVRFHVKAIYAKLNVNNRTQAIEKARQLRIL
jgi:LuxR family maltose regulon positive regulatory protein